MSRPWKLLTGRGRMLILLGLAVLVVAILSGHRDIMRIGFLLLLLPVVAALLVGRARLRMSCERLIDPPQAPLGSPLRGRIILSQNGRLPAGILMLEDNVPQELGNRPRFLVDKADLSWRREIEYPLLGRFRGRFATGPLTVRTTDPFGLVRLDRQFVSRSEVLITPQVVPLPPMRSSGGGGSSGENQPHRIGIVGEDDVLVREYRQGDDVRRIHWRSTARLGDLMVRREEQAWDPSASIVLDSRAGAHAGTGMGNSIEWAISAAASIAVHYLDDGFNIEIYDADGPMHLSGGAEQQRFVAREMMINRLSELTPRQTHTLHYGIEAAAAERSGQLVVAIMGRMTPSDAESLLRVRRNRAQGLALLLDVDSFATDNSGSSLSAEEELAEQILRENQWRVYRVNQSMSVADAWIGLDRIGALI